MMAIKISSREIRKQIGRPIIEPKVPGAMGTVPIKKPVARNRTARSRNFIARVYNLSPSLSSDKKCNFKRNNLSEAISALGDLTISSLPGDGIINDPQRNFLLKCNHFADFIFRYQTRAPLRIFDPFNPDFAKGGGDCQLIPGK